MIAAPPCPLDAWSILHALSDRVAVLDQHGAVLYCNHAWHQTAPNRSQPFVDHLTTTLELNDAARQAVVAALTTLAAGYDSPLCVTLHGRQDEREYWFRLELSRLPDGAHLLAQLHDISEQERTRAESQRSAELLQHIEAAGGDALYRLRYDSLHYEYLSPSIATLTGYTPAEIQTIGLKQIIERVEGVITSTTPDADTLSDVRNAATYRADYLIRTRSGTSRWLGDHSFPWRAADGTLLGSVGILTDITARKQAEAVQRENAAQGEQLRAQEALLQELSTPLLTIGVGTVLLPLVGALDERRAERVITTLLDGVATQGASLVILDITGMRTVDQQVAATMVRAAQAARLLGARVMLTGIRPDIAHTLCALSLDLSDLITHSTLQSGITQALATRL
jgi:PAS domain S-box-containing protein